MAGSLVITNANLNAAIRQDGDAQAALPQLIKEQGQSKRDLAHSQEAQTNSIIQ
jgi:hypothetical protein